MDMLAVEVEASNNISAQEAADASSPPREKVKKADDAAAPSSPGAVEVQVTTSLVKSSAQKVVTAKKEWMAAVTRLKAASHSFDAKVEYTVSSQCKRFFSSHHLHPVFLKTEYKDTAFLWLWYTKGPTRNVSLP